MSHRSEPHPQLTRRSFLASAAGTAVTVVLLRKASADVEGENSTYAYVIDNARCIGCGNCVRACTQENDVPEEFCRTWIERYTVTRNGEVLVESPDAGRHGFQPPPVDPDHIRKSFFVPKICNHCAKPPCVQVCPIGATFRTRDGAVLVDTKRCMGCGYCVQSCPYSARFIDPRDHVAGKCTWCYHRITKGMPPTCVAVCPVGARQFGELHPGSPMFEFLAAEHLTVLKGELGTEPVVYYTWLSKEVS